MKVSAGILAGALAVAAAGQASAAVLTATSNVAQYTDFVITFEDTNGNRLFDLNERTGFNGVRINPLSDPLDFFDLLGIPAIPGITAPTPPGSWPGTLNEWVLEEKWVFGAGALAPGEGFIDSWRYSLTGLTDPTVVPLPAGLPLLLGAIGALALLRRRAVSA